MTSVTPSFLLLDDWTSLAYLAPILPSTRALLANYSSSVLKISKFRYDSLASNNLHT